MTTLMFIGMLVLIVGVFLMGYGLRDSQTISNKIVEGVTGSYARLTIWYFIGGIVLFLFGLILIYMGWHVHVVP